MTQDERLLAGALSRLARRETFEYQAAGQRWFAPRTLDALVELCAAHPEARIVAGATDVGLWVTKQHRMLGDVIYVGDVAALHAIDESEQGLTIGAAASLARAFDALDQRFPELHESWVRFASPPIRASGTLGGNVANGSPIGDSMPALIALGARVVLARRGGTREMPLEDFYLAYQKNARQPGEVVAALHVPPRAPDLTLRAYKISKRYDQDISAVFACFAMVIDSGRIASARIGCGGVAPVPARARRAEALLAGKPWTAELARAAGEALEREFTPIDDARASARYRASVLGNLMQRLWAESSGVAARIESIAAD